VLRRGDETRESAVVRQRQVLKMTRDQTPIFDGWYYASIALNALSLHYFCLVSNGYKACSFLLYQNAEIILMSYNETSLFKTKLLVF
jgi:hypothetical protein